MRKSVPMMMILAALAAAGSTAAQTLRPAGPGGYQHPEDAVEGAFVRFYLQADGNGTAVVRECQSCAPRRLTVTPQMQVLKNGQSIEWSTGLDLGDTRVDIFFERESKRVTRVVAP